MWQVPQIKATESVTVFLPESGLYIEEVVLDRGQIRLDGSIQIQDMKMDQEYANKTIDSYQDLCQQAIEQ
jgi:hypothetical protein